MRIKILLVVIVASLTTAFFLMSDMNSKEEFAEFSALFDQADKEYLGEVFRLDEKRISPDVKQLSVKLVLAKSLKFVDEASPQVSVASSDPNFISVDSTSNTNPQKEFLFPVDSKPGQAELTINYRLFCCNSGPGAVCFFKEGRIIVPVTVADDGDDTFEIKQMIDE